MNNYLIIGKIVGVHGIRGELKILPITDDAHRFSDIDNIYILSQKEKLIRTAKISGVRYLPNMVICAIDDIDDRDEAKKLSGLFLAVDRKNAVKLPEGRYFITDLVGITVYDDTLGELGVLFEILQTGSGDVLVVRRKERRDLLIPYLNSIVYRVDINERKMYVKLPDGLFDVYEVKSESGDVLT